MEPVKNSYKINGRETVSLAVYNVGWQTCEPGWQWGPGVRDHFLIHHVVSGRGTYTAGERKWDIRAGDTFIVWPYKEVTYTADRNDPWEYYWVGFFGSDAPALLAHTDLSESKPVISVDFGDELRAALLAIYNSRGQDDVALVKMTGYLYLMLSLLVERSGKSPPGSVSLEYARRAGEYIAMHYAEELTVEDLARQTGVSRSYLFRVFKKHYGLSPQEYLLEVRLKTACRLLRETDSTIGMVAAFTGFQNSLYFSRIFKQRRGTTPSAYRQARRKLSGEQPETSDV